ncbi:carbohydrate ABC transporter permease [Aquabacterium sp.]|uniref:carbohydrate ABC transporter permease n=1 Tax=Aquabacterium sp. TaxID=1872578 RepID=UPI002B7A3E07|nr:sugar ABC transporter permease [Aquabacterium sp.]HSW03913.1 sugar ABC transporter permease [Aquabacterium sp.]
MKARISAAFGGDVGKGRGGEAPATDTRRAAWPVLMGFLAPALLVYAALTAYPVLRTFYNAFFEIGDISSSKFVGFAHFAEVLKDNTFWAAVKNTAIWAMVAPFADVATGLLLALCLYAGVPFARFLRVAWFTPVLLSYVVVGILWVWIYNYDWGIVNATLRALGLPGWAQAWIGDPKFALGALMVTHAWKWAGFNMVVCLAALHSLPSEVLEAADLDNCGWWAKLRHVIVPMLWPTLLNLYVLAFIGKMKVFDLVWVMTEGGPVWSTETVSTYVYKRAFNWNSFDLGYPSAIAVVWFIVVVAFVLGLNRLFRQRERLEY